MLVLNSNEDNISCNITAQPTKLPSLITLMSKAHGSIGFGCTLQRTAMHSITDIYAFLGPENSREPLHPDTDIMVALLLYGDDFHKLIEEYTEKFGVDMSGYLWYFHSWEEGLNIPGALLFKPPSSRVQRIPVTPAMLLDFAQSGKWTLIYPAHTLPAHRWDRAINWLFIVLLIVIGVWTCRN